MVTKKPNSVRNQYLAAICVNSSNLSYGGFIGWTSAALPLLESADSPLASGPITKEESSWIGALICVGGFIGILLFLWFAERFGRRLTFILIGGPMLVSWILISIAPNVKFLYAARVLGGISGGGIFTLIPIYITEISEDRVRGVLGSFLILINSGSILISYIAGEFMSYQLVTYLNILLCVAYIITVLFLPETPQFQLKQGDEAKALVSLSFYRTCTAVDSKELKDELSEIGKTYLAANNEKVKLTWQDFVNPIARKTLIVGIGLIALNQFCGSFGILSYSAFIFEESGSSLSSNMSAIIVGFILFMGSYVSTLLVERVGRKPLLLTSALSTGVGLASLALYCVLKELGHNVTVVNWIPLVSLSVVIFSASCGILPIAYVVVAEILPPKIKSVGLIICMQLLWLFALIIMVFLPLATDYIGLHGVMFVFSICCFMGVIFIWTTVPETKGKSLDEILKLYK